MTGRRDPKIGKRQHYKCILAKDKLSFGAWYAAHQVGRDINTESGATYHEMSVAMAVDLVSDVKGSASVLGYNGLAFLFWF